MFALIPEVLERAGRTAVGSITGFYTVLVEGDDFNEPIPDAVKGITDGAPVAEPAAGQTGGHFPAVDVVQSISRVRGRRDRRRARQAGPAGAERVGGVRRRGRPGQHRRVRGPGRTSRPTWPCRRGRGSRSSCSRCRPRRPIWRWPGGSWANWSGGSSRSRRWCGASRRRRRDPAPGRAGEYGFPEYLGRPARVSEWRRMAGRSDKPRVVVAWARFTFTLAPLLRQRERVEQERQRGAWRWPRPELVEAQRQLTQSSKPCRRP